MKKISFSVSLFILAAIIFYACKEEEISTQQFVQNHLIGRWPHKRTVNITKENGVEIKNDTILYGVGSNSLPIDTVQFLADGSCIKNGDTIKYTIDGEGKNIIYNKDAIDDTWFIQYLRLTSVLLTQEKTEKKGASTFIYYNEELLIK
ncbi:MAG: hypothetical protein V4663_00935 [Bacteroidota bacterium]